MEPDVKRRQRLTRSRDFDAVYRRGRSTATRFLILHWYSREDDDEGPARLGIGIPRAVGNSVVRNRIKRQLRAAWDAGPPPTPYDYVLVVRPGLPEAVEARGFGWLQERIAEVLGKAKAAA
jgi:ribonuclease P protein component